MKLLIVDDQSSVHLFFKKILDSNKWNITELLDAYNGQEALEIIAKQNPDLMILDISMPVMTGIELLDYLYTHKIQIKIIVLSAYNEFDYARSCIKYGVQDYLLKPIDIDELDLHLQHVIKEIQNDNALALTSSVIEYLVHPGAKQDIYISPSEFQDAPTCIGVACCLYGNTISFNCLDSVHVLCETYANDLSIYILSCDLEAYWSTLPQFIYEDFSIGLSRCSSIENNLTQLIDEAIYAISQSFYKCETQIYNPNCFQVTSDHMSHDIAQKIKTAYSRQDLSDIKHGFNLLFRYFDEKKISPDFVKDFCQALLFQLNDDYFKNFIYLKGGSFYQDVKFADALTLKNTSLRIVLTTLANVCPQDAKTDSDIVTHIKEYIDSHYECDLSLDTLSTHFFISKFQISRIFKRNYDINLSDYVLEVRMQNAVWFLCNSDLKLNEISKKVGYEDTCYFSNVFKKFYKVSPTEYKQINKLTTN